MSKYNKEAKKILEDPYNYAKKTSVDNLEELLTELNKQYRQTNKSIVPDEVYDILLDVLKERNPKSTFLKKIGAPISKDKVKLPFYMASLDKIKSDSEQTDKWKKKYLGPYTLSDKLDGVSALLVKNENEVNLYTRGNGSEGQNISYLIPYVIPKSINIEKLENDMAIRGELIISKLDFEKVNNKYSNARNAVAGLVNAKNYSKELAKITKFIAYSIVYPEYKQETQMKKLKKRKFNVVYNTTKDNVDNKMLGNLLVKRRKESNFEIDGIVVIDSSKSYKNTQKNPKYGFAYKTILTDQIAEVKVLDVLWDISMDGYLKPRLLVEQVRLVGVDINYVTAFNAKFVKNNKLAPGAIIKLVRSGDVIPHILEVIKESPTGNPKMPDIPYKWNKSKVDIVVKDKSGKYGNDIKIKLFNHFFKTLKVKNISLGIITKLVDHGYDTYEKILSGDREELYDINGFGEKLINKIDNNIKKAFKNVDLATFMGASHKFGRGFGVRKIKLILKEYPNIMLENRNKETMYDKIIEITGFDDTTTSQFVNNFKDFIKFYDQINKSINISQLKKKVTKKKKKGNLHFENQKIVFTGFRSKEIEKFINDNGGEVTGNVSGNTKLVVYVNKDNKPSSKLEKAKKLGVKVITKDTFEKKYL